MSFRKRSSNGPVLFEPSKVDLVAISPDGQTAELYIHRTEAWTGLDDELLSLQSKIHTYVGYAVDGQMHQQFPETTGLSWAIVVNSFAGPPDERTSQMLAQLQEVVPTYGGMLDVRGT